MTNPSYTAPSITSAFTPPAFPHQLTELGQARDYSTQGSLPVMTPDNVAPAVSTLNTSFYPTQASTGSNKRQRSEEQEEDAGDVDGQMRGDALQMSAAEKLKRACARCRGLKVCRTTDILSGSRLLFVDRFAAILGRTTTLVIDVSRPPKNASFLVASRDDPRRTLSSQIPSAADLIECFDF